jgi:hypothetical protein
MTVLGDPASTLDWDRLIQSAASRRVSAYVAEGLGFLRTVLGAPVPAEVIDELVAVRRPRFERACYRAMLSPPGPIRTFRRAWARYRRFRLLVPDGEPRPRFASVLLLVGGYRPAPALARAAVRSAAGAVSVRLRGRIGPGWRRSASGRSGP